MDKSYNSFQYYVYVQNIDTIMNTSEILLVFILIVCVFKIVGSHNLVSESMKSDISAGSGFSRAKLTGSQTSNSKSNISINRSFIKSKSSISNNKYIFSGTNQHENRHATNLNLATSGRLDAHDPYQADPSDMVFKKDIMIRKRSVIV